jgi:hypothetical protein
MALSMADFLTQITDVFENSCPLGVSRQSEAATALWISAFEDSTPD